MGCNHHINHIEWYMTRIFQGYGFLRLRQWCYFNFPRLHTNIPKGNTTCVAWWPYVGVVNFRVNPRFHPTDNFRVNRRFNPTSVGWNLVLTRKFTTPTYAFQSSLMMGIFSIEIYSDATTDRFTSHVQPLQEVKACMALSSLFIEIEDICCSNRCMLRWIFQHVVS